VAREKDDKHAWWKSWEDKTTNRNMRRWIRRHGHWVGWAWESCCKLANDPSKDGRMCCRKSGDLYDAADLADEALVTEEQAAHAIELFIAAEWMHRDEDGCYVVTRFYERNVDDRAHRKRQQRERDKLRDVSQDTSRDMSHEKSPDMSRDKSRQRTEDRGQRTEEREQSNPPNPPRGEGAAAPSPEPKAKAKTKRKRATGPDPLISDRPEWLPVPEWEAFHDMRSRGKFRAEWTQHAQRAVLAKLDRLRGEGYDPAMLLTTGLERGWRSVFEDDSCRAKSTATRPCHKPMKTEKPSGSVGKPRDVASLLDGIGGGA